MHEGHPDELDLLAYVDEGATTGRGREVAAHVAGCDSCGTAVRELQAARSALRSAPRLNLPADRRAGISRALDAHTAARRSYVSPMRFATLLAPVAVAAAIAVAVVQFGDGGGGNGSAGRAEQPAADRAAPEASAGGGAGEDAATMEGARALRAVRRVAGPATEVVGVLRSAGLTARLSGGRVVVSNARPAEVEDALADRAAGPVPVVIE
jgi:hypothetical protein